ncbi:MAG: hypothetical protein AB8F94_08585 [Saprospiraceae bacterium]
MIRPLEEVLAYKNKWVIERFKNTATWFQGNEEDIDILFDDLKRFLWLYAIYEEKKKTNPELDIPDIGFSESMLIIDEMWHPFILYTQFYSEFCQEYLGGFLHHPTPAKKYVGNTKSLGEEQALEIFVEELLEVVYDNLGEEVTVRWFEKYFDFAPPKEITSKHH